jgi:hypothetical protein
MHVRRPATLVALLLVPACSAATSTQPLPQSPVTAIIGELKAFAERAGFAPTRNFVRYTAQTEAVTRCYFTGSLELPETYGGLRLTSEDETRCRAREADGYDVFFYRIEAVASGRMAVTPALLQAAIERVLVVVAHEDFHNQPETAGVRTEAAEGAATLAGCITARAFARERFGAGSSEFLRLEHEADVFLSKATVVNDYAARLVEVYDAARAGTISREIALERKAGLFAELQRDCLAIDPVSTSFNRCPAAMNNAALAFDRTYTSEYRPMYRIYESADRDLAATISGMRERLRLLAAD